MSITVTIESLAAGGDGVAHDDDGRVVFVPRTAVGDRVEVELRQQKKSFARGELVAVIEPGPGRVESRCSLFAEAACGGCQWLHLSDAAQHEAKAAVVSAALRKVAGAGEILELVTPTPSLKWRRRARFHWFRPPGSAAAIIGFSGARSRRVTSVSECVQIDAALHGVYQLIVRHLAPQLHKRGEVDVIIGVDDRALVSVRGPHSRAGIESLAKEARIAGVSGRGAPIGEEIIEFDQGLPVAAGNFAQASQAGNRALLDELDRAFAVAFEAAVVPVALELYAGGGNLTRGLAKRAARVVAVERAGGPVIDAVGVEWMKMDSASALEKLSTSGVKFDLVVLDPPRSGAAECVEGIAKLAAAAIIYVSCDPATLTRDLERLIAAGYRLKQATPLDLMPQTSHVEVVAVLVRAD